jgi:inosine-uridine nucleoside N-ribohydrolase
VDDAMAILLALGSDKLHVDAITLTHGNHYDMGVMSRNAAYLFQLANKKGAIFKGCIEALEGSTGDRDGPRIHGLNGLGNIEDPTVEEEYLELINHDIEAADFLIEYCKSNMGEISIITLGPLSNLGLAIRRDPLFPTYVKRIVSMGSTFHAKGNVSPVAEANFYNDCHAAKLVTNAPWKDYTIAPLNATGTVELSLSFRERIRDVGHIGEFIYNITQHYVEFLTKTFGMTSLPVHDSSAVMYFIAPEVFTDSEIGYVDVEIEGSRTKGMAIIDTRGYYRKDPNFENKTRVLYAANEQHFQDVFISTIRNLPNKIKTEE